MASGGDLDYDVNTEAMPITNRDLTPDNQSNSPFIFRNVQMKTSASFVTKNKNDDIGEVYIKKFAIAPPPTSKVIKRLRKSI